jgi:hypothetical protein
MAAACLDRTQNESLFPVGGQWWTRTANARRATVVFRQGLW